MAARHAPVNRSLGGVDKFRVVTAGSKNRRFKKVR
jgi:hypothetical protein